MTIQIILAIIATLFVSYGLFHEDKFVAFEDHMIEIIKSRLKKIFKF